ncbi:MAG: glycosyltransferase [Candidatus Saccharibacteria bacterium]|nr:MAG: glycosyltransferase [Candidatus Saccharibacteria bacterium]
MKVAHVTLYPPKNSKHTSGSGVASYSKNLITSIQASAHTQSVVCNVIDSPEQYAEDSLDVRRVFVKKPSFIIAVHKELKKLDADVVHIQQELALYGGIVTAFLLQWLVFLWRKKVVITLHGVVDPSKIDAKFVNENNSRLPVWIVKLAFRIIYTPLVKWSQKVIVHEHYFKSILIKSYGVDAKKIIVVPHGVESLVAFEKQNAREKLQLSKNADVVLFMGYATGYKGIDLLIEGFGEYAKINRNAVLVIGAGKHPKLHDNEAYLKEYQRLQDKAAKIIPAGQYRWEGFIDETEIGLYYSASDVSLYPYTTAISSSGPMSFAIGYEKPFLVSTAFADIFAQYPHLLFERSPEAMATRLDYFFSHRNEYSETSSLMKSERTWSNVGQRTVRAYETITGLESGSE